MTGPEGGKEFDPVMRTIETEYGEGRYAVHLILHTTDGSGIAGFLYGGTHPHVGGIAINNNRDIQTEQFALPGHRDDVAAAAAAAILREAAHQPVIITAGIHIDNAGPEEIELLMENCRKAALIAADALLPCVREPAERING